MNKMTKSRFWWAIRRFWHMPHHYMECQKPDTFWSCTEFGDKSKKDSYFKSWAISSYKLVFYAKSYRDKIRHFISIFRSHFKGLIFRLKYAPRYYCCLCCNGNKGGWRTRFCEWLEYKAREAENIETNRAL